MKISENFIPVTKECVKLEELDDGGILYDTEKDVVHSLNCTADSVWICCDGKHSIEEIADVVKKCFKPESKQVLKDIIQIVRDFSGKGLLVP